LPGRVLVDGFGQRPIISSGKGIFLEDVNGKRYLDAVGGSHVVTIGHGVPEIADVVAEQIRKVSFVGTRHFLNEPELDLAEIIGRMTPEQLNWVYFVSGGAEGTEMALQLTYRYHVARGNPGRTKIIGRDLSYHGGTIAALSMGGNRARKEDVSPYLLDFVQIPPPYCYRCPFGKTYPSCELRCATELAEVIEREGRENISAFIAEPVIGSAGGAIVPPDGYYEEIRRICDEYGILFIADEVITGFGRTGSAFGVDHWSVVPDIMVCSKAIASGYAPLGAVIVDDDIIETIRSSGERLPLRLTYSGNPPSCAAGAAVQRYIERYGLIAQCARVGDLLKSMLVQMADGLSIVGDVRGMGLLLGIELVRDKSTLDPFPRSDHIHERILQEALQRGLILVGGSGAACFPDGDHLLVTPPYIITPDECRTLVALLGVSISVIAESAGRK
jgi:adenosylmethionine-8-amino-7-oxononanoate aminotransferase